jgi:YHS domain-containing protein
MISAIIRLVFFCLLVYFFINAGRWLLGRGRPRAPRFSGTRKSQPCGIDHMVQDPVCGVYLSEREAVTLRRDGVTHYFCSHECRDKFLAGS